MLRYTSLALCLGSNPSNLQTRKTSCLVQLGCTGGFMLVILGWNKLIVQWCKYCDRETLFERLCCTSSLATLYSLLFAACNGCIFMPSRTIVREIWFELEDSFFFFLRQKCVDPLVWWSGSEYLDQLSQLHVLTSVVTRKFLTRAFGTLLASVPCGMILDDMWARTHLLNSSTFTTAAVDSSRLSKRKDGKHCSNNHVCDSDHCHRTCYRSNNHIHATGKMYRTVSDVHDALGAELWSMGQRKSFVPSLEKAPVCIRHERLKNDRKQEPMPVSSSTVTECYPSEWIGAYQTANTSSIVPAMSPLVCPLSWETVMTAPGNYIACCPPYVSYPPSIWTYLRYSSISWAS